MESQEHRMQCLRMAFELGGKPENVLSAAEQLLKFVTGTSELAAPVATTIAAAAEPAEAPPAPHIEEPTVAAVVADPIAACGTAMQMTDSGDLADATPTADAAPTTDEAHAVEAEAVKTLETSAASEVAHVEEPAAELNSETLIAETPVTDESEPAVEIATGENPAEAIQSATEETPPHSEPETIADETAVPHTEPELAAIDETPSHSQPELAEAAAVPHTEPKSEVEIASLETSTPQSDEAHVKIPVHDEHEDANRPAAPH